MKASNFYILLALSVLVYFSNIGGTSIYILDEAKNAGCAMEMLATGEWVVPTFNGSLRTDKPPLHYYFMMLAFEAFGVTPFAARFFSALAGVVLVLGLYKLVSKSLNEQTAFFSSVALLSSVQLTVQFHLAVPDPYLILFLTLGLLFFFQGFNDDRRKMKWFYVCCALAFLSKGLIAIVLPGVVVLIFLLLTGGFDRERFSRLWILPGGLIFLAISLPWYAAVGMKTDGAWLQGFFMEHNLRRYTSTMEGHRGFPLAPFVILLVALLPFSVFIFQAVQRAWRCRRQDPLLLFSLIVAFVFGTFFSFSRTLLPSYPAPAIPFVAIVLGSYLSQLVQSDNARVWPSFLVINFLISAVLTTGAYVAVGLEASLQDVKAVAAIFLVLPLGLLLSFYFYRMKQMTLVIYSTAGSWIALGLLFFWIANPAIDARNPVVDSESVIDAHRNTHKIVAYKLFNPAYVFALRQVIPEIDSDEELRKLLSGGERVLVLTRAKYMPEISDLPSVNVVYRSRDLFETSETVLLAN